MFNSPLTPADLTQLQVGDILHDADLRQDCTFLETSADDRLFVSYGSKVGGWAHVGRFSFVRRPLPVPAREGVMGGGDVIATVDPARWDHPLSPQLAYAYGWNDALTAREEAPAEGAGEVTARGGQWDAHTGEDYAVVMLPNETTDTASIQVYSDDLGLPQRIADALNLRARTSEPEARESLDDAARRLFAVQYPGRDYGDLKADTKIEWLRPAHKDLFHPAPASADKLRVAKEALEPFAAIAGRYLTGGLRSDLDARSPDLIKRLRADDFYRARQALAALSLLP